MVLLCMVFVMLIASTPVVAVDLLKVMALFPGKAMVEIDGTRRFLRVGDATPEGVVLISANSHGAVIEVDGKRENFKLGSSYGGNFAKSAVREVRIPRNSQGAFVTLGSVNGRSTEMLVDTGATTVAMSEIEAKRLGISYRLDGVKSGVQTASGFANAYQVSLSRVQVGDIELTNVDAMVIKGNSPHAVLLGMSFLKRVNMEIEGSVLVLSGMH